MSTLKVWEGVRSTDGSPFVRLDSRVTTNSVTFTGTAGQSAAFDDDTTVISVLADADCAVKIAGNPTATTADFPVPAGVRVDFRVEPGQKISAVANPGASGGSALPAGAATSAKQDTIIGHVDGIETALTTLVSHVDGLEGFTDGLETVIASTNTLLTTQAGYVDGLETLLTTQAGYLDGVEGLLGAVATETTLASASAKLPASLGAKTGAASLSVVPASDASFAVTGTFWQATQPVSGTVAATQSGAWNVTDISGTVSLPTGAATEVSVAAAAASLAIIDDWDESDRVKTNPIVGQAGVAAGAGAVGATVQRVTLASDDPAVSRLPTTLGPKAASASLSTTPAGLQYETVAASASAQVIGGTGATGDYLSHVNVQPTSTAPGVVTILDNAVEVHAWPGGTVGADLKPFPIPVGAFSVSGAWKITTGANVKVTAFGSFTA